MVKFVYETIENYMLEKMSDSAHDRMHVYRVLYLALDIAETEPDADTDILIAACLLHDVGRSRQYEDIELDHAEIGADMAYEFLTGIGWSGPKARRAADCVKSHRYRRGAAPESPEAKILFDADKLDATGAVGIARTLFHGGKISEPLYIVENGEILLDGGGAEVTSFFQEYNYKLRNLYDKFYTERGRQIAAERMEISLKYYDSLLSEIRKAHELGESLLDSLLV